MTRLSAAHPTHPDTARTGPAVFTIGVVADTHIPDRVSGLHPGILPALRAAGVRHILHAGDICLRGVLDELAGLAPVTAVRGNRDLLAGQLAMIEEVELGGAHIALMHGHGGWGPYLRDKWKFLLSGYRLERYLKLLQQASPRAQVVVFGHTHYPTLTHHAGRLLFNPGSASFGCQPNKPPSIGLLHVAPGSPAQVTAEIIQLEGWRIKFRRWVAI